MASRCPGSQLVGPARLMAHIFLINGRGFASVIPALDRVVHGLLWKITPADEAALDRYEGVVGGYYLKEFVAVHLDGSSEAVQALVYVASNNRPGAPQPGYLEKIARAARRHGFPAEYVADLEAWMTTR